ncbi:MAG TPA: TIGR00282 family metallophosphoesterase [Candidatus Saccharimonadia bacterium]|nr:TIGR00282 family metallophosphoesterase [Candidatus Saccharimonadia bacterium]
MKILYIGDIMGRPGRQTVQKVLPGVIKDRGVDFVIAQGENLSSGKGLQIKAAQDMQEVGVDFFSAGDWTLHRPEIYPWLEDPAKPAIRPANYPEGTPGRGYKLVDTPHGRILVASLLGQTVGYRALENLQNPLVAIDQILEATRSEKLIARIVNFHGDFSSEKLVIGQYLDGRVTAAVGDHWHVPTADARVLSGGTAHITDVGMVGSRDSSLGIKSEIIIARWLSENRSRNELETSGAMQFCAVLIDVDTSTGLARDIEQIIKFV